MILFKDMKATVHSSDGDTDFFDIDSGVLQVDILALYGFILFTQPLRSGRIWYKVNFLSGV